MERLSSCTLDCPDGCSTIITIHDDGSRSIKGNPEHPFTQGFACKKSKHGLSRITSPYRITTPLMRKGDTFIPVSWDEALSTIANQISKLRTTPEKMLHLRGYGFRGVLADASKYFFGQLGTTTKHGALCDDAGIEAVTRDFGSLNQNSYEELHKSVYVVNWGRDVSRNSIHTATLIRNIKKAGCRVLSISPASAKEAAKIHLSDDHVQIRPGTDRFFAAAVIKKLIPSIPASILERASNSQEFIEYINSLDSNKLLEKCGATHTDVDKFVAIYADKAPAASIIGWGLQRYLYGGENVRFINALAMLSGNIGISGGGSYFGIGTGRNFNTSWAKSNKKRPSVLLPKLGEELEAGSFEFIWCDGTNAVNQVPDSNRIAEAFSNVKMVVVVDAFMNDTAKRADIILPCALVHEREDVLGSYFHDYIQYSGKVFEPAGDARSDFNIFLDLAQRLSIPMPDPETVLEQALDTTSVTSLTANPLAVIRKQGFLPTKHPSIAYEGLVFDHPDGKCCLPDPVLHDEPLPLTDYPLALLTFINKDYTHSQIPEDEQDELLKAFIHPETLKRYGLRDGKQAVVVSPIGKLTVIATADTASHPESVVIRRGGWMMFNRCANTIIEPHVTDMGDNAAFYSQKVRIEPA